MILLNMHDETGCFLLKNKTEGVYVIVSKSQGHHFDCVVRGNSCALLSQHGLPWALWIPTPRKEVLSSEQTCGWRSLFMPFHKSALLLKVRPRGYHPCRENHLVSTAMSENSQCKGLSLFPHTYVLGLRKSNPVNPICIYTCKGHNW